MQKLKTKIGILVLAFVFLMQPVFATLTSDSSLGPRAQFTATPTAAMTGNSVSFDASKSRDARGGQSLQYRWDFESNYKWTRWSSTPKITYTFTEAGNYATRLQVKDSDNLVDETALSIHVQTKRNSSVPFAKIHVSPETGDTSTNFHFTVEVFSNIHTPTHLLEVRLDWDNDGKWDTDWSKSRDFYHVFAESGQREVRLEVRDTDGSSSIERGYYIKAQENDAMRTKKIGLIQVESAGNPRASFRTWPVEISQDTNVHFDASASIRANEYRWDFDGDGRFDTAWNSANQKIQKIYSTVGVFQASLEVRNSLGKTDLTERTITVSDTNNILPEAKFTMRNQTNTLLNARKSVLRDEIYFSAASSNDADGSNAKLQVRWDFEGDGIFDTTFNTDKRAIHRYTSIGIHKPTL